MSKITKLFSIIALGAAAAACNPNVYPGFDDKDAFVSFDKAAFTIKENGGKLQIPVSLASVKGTETTISYAAVEGTAKLGKDFELEDGSATLRFTAEKRTQYITINIIDRPGEYTGDLKFSLSFKSTGDVNAGTENSCTVTISDLDHPLSFILGVYSFSGTDYWGDSFDCNMIVDKDPEDVNKVWVGNLSPYLEANGYTAPNYNYYYGIVNEDKTSIIVPRGQKLGYQDLCTMGFNGPDPAASELTDILIQISPDGKTLTFPNAWGIASNPDGEGYWELVPGGAVFTKK